MVLISSCSSAFEHCCLSTRKRCCPGKVPSLPAPGDLVPAAESQQHCSLTPNSSTLGTGPTLGEWDAFPILQQVLACPEQL